MKLTKNDYSKIVTHYGYNLPKTRKGTTSINKTRKLALKILANKLCKCIKAVQKTGKNIQENGAISICNKTIFSNRNLKHYNFTCKKKSLLKKRRNYAYALSKTRKNIRLG